MPFGRGSLLDDRATWQLQFVAIHLRKWILAMRIRFIDNDQIVGRYSTNHAKPT